MVVYRIADSRYIKDLTGKGAALYGGRWNNKDTYMVYTAQSPALALLEAVVHIGNIPMVYSMIGIELPDTSIKTYTVDELPYDWQKHPSPDSLRKMGDSFIKEQKYLILKVPSVLMPEEHNLLLNPQHKDFRHVKVISSRKLEIDGRLLRNDD